MNSSGKKRGAALVAGAALALGGLAFAPASAQTIGQGEPAFEFYTQNFDASTKFDGSNQTVSMLSGVPNGAGIAEVRYSYLKGATAVEIDEVAVVNGVAATEWTPPTGAEGAAITGVRAEALDAAETVLTTVNRAVSPVTNTGMQDNAAIELDGALRSRIGLGPDGEVVASGHTTGLAAGTFLANTGPAAAGGFVAVNPANVSPPDGQGVSTFKGVVPIMGANNTADAEDEIVLSGVGQEAAGFSDDANVYTMYNQVTSSVTTPLAPGFSANVQLGGANNESRWNITVLDQEGQPIQGLNVCEVATTADLAACNGAGNGTPDVGETDVNGVYQASIFEATMDNANDRNPAANVQSTYYLIDVDQNGAYISGIDFRVELTQTGFLPVATSVVLSSELGNTLDDDEAPDVTALVTDQNGNPLAGKVVTFSGEIRCINAPAADVVTPLPPFPALTDANGEVIFTNLGDFGGTCEDGPYTVTLDAYANNDGDPAPGPGDAVAQTLNLDYDITEVVWDNGTTSQVENGSTTTQSGTLQQQDGDALSGDRIIQISYNPSDNSEIADAQTLPTQKVNDTTAVSETDANGKFSVAVTDPALPDGEELGSQLTAQSTGLETSGADQTDGTITIDFLRSVTPDRVRIINLDTGDEQDGLLPGLFAPELIPGNLGLGTVEVENADGVLLTDVDVNVTIDEGNFVDITDTPFEPGAPGDEVDFVDDGKNITVTTDDSGSALFVANIERNTGFDDDGEVDDNMTATAGPASDVHDLTWTTNFVALNNGSFTVELSDDQESTILPQARAGDVGGSGQVVNYDVVTTDQFGNRTSQPTTTTDNTPAADFFGGVQSEFALNQPAIEAFADEATNQELEVELDFAIETTYVDDPADSSFDPNNPGLNLSFDPVQLEAETDAINWYDLDLNASTFTLSQDGPNQVPAQSAVTMVLHAEDQEGQALTGLGVDFLRGGPGDEDDDGCQFGCFAVDEDGNAFYDFVGGSQGTATVSAVVYEDNGTRFGTVGTDTVIFGANVVKINAKLSGKNQGNKDVLKVDAPSNADGAKVKLQKKTANGWKQIGKAKTLNGLGNTTFKVADKNGNKITRYRALVGGTVDTKADTTNQVRQR